jgi:hypothetical protein
MADDVSKIANTNQSGGLNPMVAMRYAVGNLFNKRNRFLDSSSSGGGGEAQNAAWFKNQETLAKAQSMLKREEEANSANIMLQKQELLPERLTAAQEASKVYDRQGRHIGQQAFNDKDTGLSMAGLSIPTTHEDAMERDNQAAELAMRKATHSHELREEGARNRAEEKDKALSAKERAKKVAGLEKERDQPIPGRTGEALPETPTTRIQQQQRRDILMNAFTGSPESASTRQIPTQFMDQFTQVGDQDNSGTADADDSKE